MKQPNPQMPAFKPFDESDVRALLRQVGQGSTSEIRYRDRAIILFLLDSGVRASKLCNLRIANVDLKQGSALVRGKGRLDQGVGRQRMAFMAGRVQRAIQVVPLSRFYQSWPKRMGLILGFPASAEEDLFRGVASLSRINISSHTS